MKLKTVSPFFDLLENVNRKEGDEFEATEDRFEEINGGGFGILVERVEEKPKRRRATAKKGAE